MKKSVGGSKHPDGKTLLFASMLLPMLVDLALTVTLQPEEFWKNSMYAVEGSPLGLPFLQKGASFFVLGFFVWVLLAYFILLKLPGPLDLVFLLTVIIAHSWGAASWLPRIFGGGFYCPTILYFVLVSAVTVFFWKKSGIFNKS